MTISTCSRSRMNSLTVIVPVVLAMLLGTSSIADSRELKSLRLLLAPPSGAGAKERGQWPNRGSSRGAQEGDHGNHGGHGTSVTRPQGEGPGPGRPPGTDSGDHTHGPAQASGRPGGGQRPTEESEHRPLPKRTYYLSDHRPDSETKAYIRRADGSVFEPELHMEGEPSVSFPTPFGDGPSHGGNNVYVVEEGIEGDVLTVRTAKWITLHHNCGWGHEGKFDDTLINPQFLETVPFEIVIDKLWDPNFHARVASGNELHITALSFGKPVPGATITLTTEKGWNRTVTSDDNGVATIQMIRDYYPPAWSGFHRTHRGQFLVTARFQGDQKGTYEGKHYERVNYVATHPWKYSPSERDYSSYSFGLLVGALAMTVSGVGVYAYRERRKRPYRTIVFDE